MDERLDQNENDDQENDIDAVFRRVKTRYKDAQEHSATWRKDAVEDYAFYAGDQWSPEDKEKLRSELRPCIVFNRIGPVIDAVSGTEVNNRQETRYLPRETGDVEVNELLSSAAKYFRDHAQAEDEESDAFIDALISGLGWTQTTLSFDDNPSGEMITDRIDPLEMFWDPTARKRNLVDARYVIRVRDVSLDEARSIAPDAEDEDLHAGWAADLSSEGRDTHRVDPPLYEGDRRGDKIKTKQVRLVECEWWERKPSYLVVAVDPETGQPTEQEFDKEQYQALSARGAELGVPVQGSKFYKKCFYKAIVGAKVLSYTKNIVDGFTYNAITGKRDRNNNSWYGLVRTMKDPQRWANKWLSQSLHIINTNAKGGIMAEESAFVDVRQAEQTWARADKILWLAPSGAQKILPKPQAQFPAAIQQLMEFAINSIRDTSGVNLELLGLADRQQAGYLEQQRKQAGITILATLFDSLRRYRKTQGKVLLELIQKYMNDGRLIRIAGEGYERYVGLALDPAVKEYDVIVDEAPTAPNQKENTWVVFTQLLPIIGNHPILPQLLAEFIRFAPLPASLGNKISELMKQAAQQPPDPLQEAQIQGDMQLKQGQIAKTNAEASLTAAKAEGEKIKNSVPFTVQ